MFITVHLAPSDFNKPILLNSNHIVSVVPNTTNTTITTTAVENDGSGYIKSETYTVNETLCEILNKVR